MSVQHAVLLWALLGGSAAVALAPEPDSFAAQLETLCKQVDHLAYRLAGRSPQGRPIPLVIATARPSAIDRQLRVMVIARQHGDEPAPARAAWLWLRTDGVMRAPFEHVAVFLLPTLNPDGAAAGTRANGAGVDLNRDWLAQTQPETRLATALFRRWQPHVVIDLHEFWDHEYGDTRPGSLGGHPEWLEMLTTGRPDRRELEATTAGLLARAVRRQRAVGEPVIAIHSGGDLSLCHRYFADRHRAVAILVETKDGHVDPEARALNLLVADLANHAATFKPRLDRLRGLTDWRSPEPLTPPAPSPAPAPCPPPVQPPPAPTAWALASAGLLLFARSKFRGADVDS